MVATAFINNLDDRRPYGNAYYDSTMALSVPPVEHRELGCARRL